MTRYDTIWYCVFNVHCSQKRTRIKPMSMMKSGSPSSPMISEGSPGFVKGSPEATAKETASDRRLSLFISTLTFRWCAGGYYHLPIIFYSFRCVTLAVNLCINCSLFYIYSYLMIMSIDSSCRYASPHLWKQLPNSFRQPHQSCLDSPPHPLVNPSLSSFLLSSFITPSLFHSRLSQNLPFQQILQT